VSSRFYRWRQAGIWQRLLEVLQAEADRQGRVDWDLHFVDSTIVRAHQHAAGARRAGGEKDTMLPVKGILRRAGVKGAGLRGDPQARARTRAPAGFGA
jgi:hypothetical protein